MRFFLTDCCFDILFNKNRLAMRRFCMFFPPDPATTEGFTGEARFVPNFCGWLFPRLAYEQVDSTLGQASVGP
jgi:hypothetical protein